jgi:ribose transport system permease protein
MDCAVVELANDAPGHSNAHGGVLAFVLRSLSFRNISALYIFAVLFAIFSVCEPSTFLSMQTWRSLLDDNAIVAMAAVALVIPLSAGAINLAVGSQVGFGAILVAWFLVNRGVPIVPAVAVTIAAGGAIGVATGIMIVRARIDSFIGTLAVSSILLALVAWLSNSTQILNLGTTFQTIATNELFGITYSVYLTLIVALIVWYVLERTPSGRRVYATGGNLEAARLSGVATSRVIVLSMMWCGCITAFAGVLLSSRLGVGDPTVGPSFLLPAFSAAFLGATQFRGGRFNVWGTIVAVYVLAVGVKGLQLAGAPVWIPNLFNGVALIAAVALAKQQRLGARRRLSRLAGRNRDTVA